MMDDEAQNADERETRDILFAEERRRAIVERLRLRGKVTVEAMTLELGVSSPTIRADLSRLEERGLLRRTHGGAIAVGSTLYEPPYAERAVLRQAEKRAIAEAAVALVQEGETLLLDAGTTCHEIALRLKEFRRLTVVTNSLVSAQVLAENDGLEVVVVGGTLQSRRRATLGALAARLLEAVQCDRAFVGVSGIDVSAGLTVVDFDAAQIKRKMLEKSKQPIIVADSGKIGQVAFACIAPLGVAALLITDAGISTEDRLLMEAQGLKVCSVGMPRA